MKKIVALLLALGLGLTACAASGADIPPEEPGLVAPVVAVDPAPTVRPVPMELPEPEPVWTGAEGVTFSMLQDVYPVGTTKLTMVIDNRSETEIGWGNRESYEKFVDGQWQKLEYVEDVFFTDELRCLQPDSIWKQTLHALKFLPALDEGLYRVTGSEVFLGDEKVGPWQVTFRITADAQPEPDYALYISGQPIPTVEGCAVLDRLPGYFINTTGEDAQVLLIPYLEKLSGDGTWTEVPFKDQIGFCGTPDPLPPEGKAWYWEISFLWGSLEDGRYRLTCKAGSEFDPEGTASGEFTLYTPENNAGLPLASRN